MSDNKLLKSINDIDDDLISEAESWKPRKARKLKIAIIAAAAAVLCGATAVTAVASLKTPVDFTINDEPVEVEYTVYTDDKGREIRTYAYKLPDYSLGEEIEGHTAVGQVRVVLRDDDLWGGLELVDEEGNVFHGGINNKIVEYQIAGEKHTVSILSCRNILDEYNVIFINSDKDNDSVYDNQDVYVIRADDEETHKRICEAHGKPYFPFKDPFAE